MLSSFTPTEVAFAMAGPMQVVPAMLWLVGGWLVDDTRRAALHWAVSPR